MFYFIHKKQMNVLSVGADMFFNYKTQVAEVGKGVK